MKMKLNKSLIITGIGILIILISILSFLLYKEVYSPRFKEEKVVLYGYQQKTNIDYKAVLKPNVLYEQESIGPGEVYISELIDHIQANFSYEFIGERAAELEGNYEIIAELQGAVKEGETTKTIWKKAFVLLPKQTFQVKDKTLSLKGNTILRLEEYNNFVKTVNESSKVNAPVSFTVSMNVNIKANTDKGVVEEKLSPKMVIPLNTNYFSIDSQLTEEKPGQIEETKQVPIPVNQTKVIVYGVMIGLLVILGIFIIFFTEIKAPVDPRQKKLKQIFKKHGNRLVALNDEPAITYETYSKVKSIDDLVRIADELGKPIMYQYRPNPKDITQFYILDDTFRCMLDVRDGLNLDENIIPIEEKVG